MPWATMRKPFCSLRVFRFLKWLPSFFNEDVILPMSILYWHGFEGLDFFFVRMFRYEMADEVARNFLLFPLLSHSCPSLESCDSCLVFLTGGSSPSPSAGLLRSPPGGTVWPFAVSEISSPKGLLTSTSKGSSTISNAWSNCNGWQSTILFRIARKPVFSVAGSWSNDDLGSSGCKEKSTGIGLLRPVEAMGPPSGQDFKFQIQ